MSGVKLYYVLTAAIASTLAVMMMTNWSRAPRGIRAMATKLGVLRYPAGLVLIAISAFLVFGQRF